MTDKRTDGELVAAGNRGDRQALDTLYWRHRDWVYGQAFRFCGSRSDAQDIVQQVFVYFFGKFPGLTLRCEVRTLLYPVIRHRAIDLIRERQRRDATALELRLQREQSRNRQLDAVEDIVAGLPPDQRDVVLLRFDEGQSLAAIADRLGVPIGTVKSRLHNALHKLRRTRLRIVRES